MPFTREHYKASDYNVIYAVKNMLILQHYSEFLIIFL